MPDGSDWIDLLGALTSNEIHGSWRRAVLLSIVRAEDADDLLDYQSARLLENDAALLIELIRTVMAVDVEPAT